MTVTEIKKDIQSKLSQGMTQLKSRTDEIMKEGSQQYYNSGNPRIYQRTMQSLKAPMNGILNIGTSHASLLTGYEPSQIGGYSTGMRPSGETVFEWMINGSHGTLGDHGFAERAILSALQEAHNIFSEIF